SLNLAHKAQGSRAEYQRSPGVVRLIDQRGQLLCQANFLACFSYVALLEAIEGKPTMGTKGRGPIAQLLRKGGVFLIVRNAPRGRRQVHEGRSRRTKYLKKGDRVTQTSSHRKRFLRQGERPCGIRSRLKRRGQASKDKRSLAAGLFWQLGKGLAQKRNQSRVHLSQDKYTAAGERSLSKKRGAADLARYLARSFAGGFSLGQLRGKQVGFREEEQMSSALLVCHAGMV